MYPSQGKGKNRSGDWINFFGGRKRQDPWNLELVDINFGNGDLALSSIRNVFVPVGKLKCQPVVSRGKRQHAFVGERFVLNLLVAALLERIAQVFLGYETQVIAVFIKNLNADMQFIKQ